MIDTTTLLNLDTKARYGDIFSIYSRRKIDYVDWRLTITTRTMSNVMFEFKNAISECERIPKGILNIFEQGSALRSAMTYYMSRNVGSKAYNMAKDIFIRLMKDGAASTEFLEQVSIFASSSVFEEYLALFEDRDEGLKSISHLAPSLPEDIFDEMVSKGVISDLGKEQILQRFDYSWPFLKKHIWDEEHDIVSDHSFMKAVNIIHEPYSIFRKFGDEYISHAVYSDEDGTESEEWSDIQCLIDSIIRPEIWIGKGSTEYDMCGKYVLEDMVDDIVKKLEFIFLKFPYRSENITEIVMSCLYDNLTDMIEAKDEMKIIEDIDPALLPASFRRKIMRKLKKYFDFGNDPESPYNPKNSILMILSGINDWMGYSMLLGDYTSFIDVVPPFAYPKFFSGFTKIADVKKILGDNRGAISLYIEDIISKSLIKVDKKLYSFALEYGMTPTEFWKSAFMTKTAKLNEREFDEKFVISHKDEILSLGNISGQMDLIECRVFDGLLLNPKFSVTEEFVKTYYDYIERKDKIIKALSRNHVSRLSDELLMLRFSLDNIPTEWNAMEYMHDLDEY